MHTRAVTCRMCKSKFFPASLKFHIKVRIANERFPAPYIRVQYRLYTGQR